MASVLSRIQIILEANAANYNNELRRARENSSTSFAEMGKSASKMALVVGTALAGMGALSVKTAMSFETAMAEVNKTVDFTANYALADLKTELEDLTKVMPLTFEELAKIAAAGGQSGVAAEGLKEFTETIAKMSIAFDITADETADAMAKIASSYNVPIENVKELGDAINEVSNSGAVKANQIVDFMLRVGQSASNINIAGEAAAALGGALIDAGGSVEVVGTAMKSIFTDMSSTQWIKDNSAILSGLGIDMKEYAEVVKTDGLAAFMMIREGVMSAENPVETLNDLFSAAGGNAASLFSEGSKVEAMLGSVGQVAGVAATHIGSLDNEYQAMADTAANGFVLLQNSARLILAAAGEAFLPAVRQMTDALIPLVQKVAEWAKANPELITSMTLVTGALLGTIVGLKLAVDGFTAAKTTIDGLKEAFTVIAPVVKSAFTLLTGGIGLPLVAIAALIAAGVLLYQNWDYVKEKAIELNEYVKSVFGSLPEPLQQAGRDIAEIFQFIWNIGKEYLTLVGELYSGTFESFKTIATGALQIVWSIVKVSFSGIVNTVSTALQIVATVFSAGFALVKNTVTTVLGVIKAVITGDFKAIPGIIGNGLKTAAGIVGSMMTGILNIIKEAGKKLFSIGKDFISGFINGIKSMASGAAGAASTMVGNAIEAVRKRQNSNSDSKVTIALGQDFSGGMKTGIKRGAKAVKTAAQKMAEDAIKATQDGIAGMQRELALFGNTSKVAEYQYDISTGKFGGNTGQLLELAKQLELRKTESSVISDIVSMQREMHNLTTPYTNELSKIKYELESIEGKYKDVNELQKELLLEAADELDAYRLANTARSAMLDIARQMALLDDDSMFAALSYDLNDVNNQLSELSDTIKTEWLEAAANLENAKESKAINDSLAKSYEALHKEITLFGNSGAMAELNYELEYTRKYAGASEEALNKYADAITKLAAVKSDKAFSDLLSDNEGINESPAGKIMKEYQDKLDVIAEYERLHTELLQQSADARNEVERAANRAKFDMYVDTGELIFGALSDASKSMLGEQSKVHRALFIAEKAFSIARAVMNIQVAMSSAAASLPFPANLGAIATVATNVAGIIGTISSLKPPAIQGQAHNGLDYVPREGTYLLDKGERVVKPRDNRKLSDFLDNTDGYQSKVAPVVNMTIENHAGVPVSQRVDDDGRIRVIVGEELNKQMPMQINNPHSATNTALKNNYRLQRKLG